MAVEDAILYSMMIIILAIIFVLLQTISWGFTTMADCLDMNFDPICYSQHENSPTVRDTSLEPMWWPHQNEEEPPPE